MAVTNLFKIGHLPYKIVKFTKFSMKQVCKPKKKPTLMLTLVKVVVSSVFFPKCLDLNKWSCFDRRLSVTRVIIRIPTPGFRILCQWNFGIPDSLSCIPDFKAQGRDPFDQNFRKLRSKTRWTGSVQPEKFPKNGHLLRRTTFPGRTGRNFGWMGRAPGFQIPQRKIFRIPGGTSKNLPDSGIRIPLHGTIKSGMQSLNHNVVKMFW